MTRFPAIRPTVLHGVPGRLAPAAALAVLLAACGDDKPGGDDTGLPTEDLPLPTWYTDADGDGYGDPDGAVQADERPSGTVAEAGDCDDADPEVHPGADEVCNGADDDCDGEVDEGFADADEDGTPDCLDVEDCDGVDNDGDGEVDEGFADTDGDGTPDCLDVEDCDGVDNDGDGEVDEGFDADGDGYTPCAGELDCDDGDAAVSPAAAEVADNGVDDDCDGLVDEGAWAAGDLVITEVMVNPKWVSDRYGEWIEVYNASGRTVYLDGIVVDSGDDGDVLEPDEPFALEPGAYAVLGREADPTRNGGVDVDIEIPDISLANESDGVALIADGVELDSVSWDDGATMPDEQGASLTLDPTFLDAAANDDPGAWCAAPETWGLGRDSGSPGAANPLCPTVDHDGDGYAEDDGDCDDEDPAISPGAAENWYDGVDQDCDGWDDDDADYDGFAADFAGGADCDDTRADVNPDQPEVCGDADEDCNGLVDDDDPGVTDPSTWFRDSDGDGYGDPDDAVSRCEQPPGYVANAEDCLDSDAAVSPDGTEICGNGVDDDCDGTAGVCGPEGDLDLGTVTAIEAGATGDGLRYGAPGGDADDDGKADFWVAAPDADDGTNSDVGAAWLLAGPGTDGLSAALAGGGAAHHGEGVGPVAGDFDFDGDGAEDVLLGAPDASGSGSGSGAAYLLLGPLSGELDVGSADLALSGAAANDRAGYALAAADLDGDGADDLVIGAPNARSGSAAVGIAYVIAGPLSGSVDLSSAGVELRGATTGERVGYAVAAAGDTDGDGQVELIVGAPWARGAAGSEAGVAYLVEGPVTTSGRLTSLAMASLSGAAASEHAGTAVAGAGDVDGDGYDDLLVGAPGAAPRGAGAAYVVRGPVTGSLDLAAADTVISGDAPSDELGTAVTAADLDGDGLSDVIVGAPSSGTGATGGGAAFVFFGPTSGSVQASEAGGVLADSTERESAGSTLAAPGDVDGDGYEDLLVGAPDANTGDGAIFVVPGGVGY